MGVIPGVILYGQIHNIGNWAEILNDYDEIAAILRLNGVENYEEKARKIFDQFILLCKHYNSIRKPHLCQFFPTNFINTFW